MLKTNRVPKIPKIITTVNEVEFHLYIDFPHHEQFDFSSKHDNLLMAHQPLGGQPAPVVRGHPSEPFPTEAHRMLVDNVTATGCNDLPVGKGIPVQKYHLE
ncbi:hypothetical protein B0T19DRAFT_399781 [Cercophora scortea]|uniref:Uncharacterized protein n=1 Tax=Cercophora scortea TaxID=314031 RepID=A0AAE0IZJ3_9PEZI|nr:hypothetical protein B0T19DRAFT_399781 [Cercophora scortea]